MLKPIRLHWAHSKPNFGDALSPLIVECVSGRPVVHAKPASCDLIAVGSLLQRLKERPWSRRVHIWGTGFIGPGPNRASRHYVHATRGPHSRDRLQIDDPDLPMGDPALLLGLLRERMVPAPRRYPLTVIPHYKDKNSDALKAFLADIPGAQVLDIFADPWLLMGRIAASDLVLSSAMHGLIAADALGVPNARVTFGGEVRGGDFKFEDYYRVFGLPATPEAPGPLDAARRERLIDGYHRPGIDAVKERLLAAFPRGL